MGSISAISDAQYVPSLRRWRFEMKPSLFFFFSSTQHFNIAASDGAGPARIRPPQPAPVRPTSPQRAARRGPGGTGTAAADAVADNPVVAGPNGESPGKEPTPFAPHKPNIGACCVPLSCTWNVDITMY